MSRLLAIYLAICGLKRGPQDLPASRSLLYLSGTLYAATIWLYEIREGDVWTGLPTVILGIVTTWALYSSLLRFNEKEARLTQTLSASFGCNAIFNLAAAPIRWPWADAILAKTEPPPGFGLMLFAIIIWSLVIEGHVVRNAIDTSLGKGMAIALAFAIISVTVLVLVRSALP
ncbi:MAG: hypothetical protein DHS20C11_37910 [Lysobacteraceae bacterium]|nr:MAG: hypothetical protein DHS20C11_37910 [Xanthomonadaceae bacterium]